MLAISPAAAVTRAPGPARRRPLDSLVSWSARSTPRTLSLLAAVYIAAWIVTTGVLAVGHLTVERGWWPERHLETGRTLLGFLQFWDGHAYAVIATGGYPDRLPVDAQGFVEQNEWAFLPVYPVLVAAVTAVTALPFTPAAVLLTTVFGFTATVLLHRLVERIVGHRRALWAAVLSCTGPLAFLHHVTYPETLFLTLLFGALLAMRGGRMLPLLLLGTVAAFTHPGQLALPVALAVDHVTRIVRHEHRSLARHAAVLVTGALLALAGLAWPLVVSAVTGTTDAYVQTELAWWRDIVPIDGGPIPFAPWFLLAGHHAGPLGVALVVAVLAASAMVLVRRSGWLGPRLTGFVASYWVYLVAVFLPQESLFRLMLPMSPALAAPVLTRTDRRALVLVCIGVALQPIAVLLLWITWPP